MLNHNKLKHGRPDSDPPSPPPAAKRRIDDNTEVSLLRKQIAELADKLEKQAEEISRLQSAFSNLTETQTHNKKPLTPTEPAPAPPTPPVKPEHIPQQWKVRTPSHPIHRNNAESRLLLDIIIPRDKQAKGQAVTKKVNDLLKLTKAPVMAHAVLYSKKGRPIVISSNAEALSHQAHLVYEGIFGEPPSPQLRAYPDHQQYRVKLNSIPTMSLQSGHPISPDLVLKFLLIPEQDLACPAHWLRPAYKPLKESGTIVLPFRSREAALQFHRQHDYLIFGTHCRTSLYTDNPPKTHRKPAPPTTPLPLNHPP